MKENEKRRNVKGITLIALVITIIVLLILAGVSIAMLTGDNGILAQAQKAKNETENAQLEEENALTGYEQIINASIGITLETITGKETNNTVTQDKLGNRVVVPAGFRVVNPEDNVEDGIIIEDVAHEETKGSQFVWIPVGTVHKKDKEDITIKLSRYTFDSSGNPTDQGSNIIANCFQEVNTGKENITAKENIESDIEGFRGSAIKNGGYYIGRYEARTVTPRNSGGDLLTQVTLKPNDYVYNYVTQNQAAEISRGMYSESNFKSDLINSYAWDTAIDFLQKCDNRTDKNSMYSAQTSLNIGNLAEKGTIGTEKEDIICNMYDMASNCWEWTTETSNLEKFPSTGRGGVYSNNISYGTAGRYYGKATEGYGDSSFRPILYL